MVKKWLPGAAIGLVGIALLSAARKAEAAKYLSGSIKSIKVTGGGLSQLSLAVSVIITNPGPVDIRFDSMNANLYMKGAEFASLVINKKGQDIFLRGFTDTVVTFPVQVSLFAVGNQLKEIIKNGTTGLNIVAQGNVYSGALLIPFSTTYAVTTPAAVKGFLRRRNKRQAPAPAAEIGKTDVKLQFDTVQEMEDYFNPLRSRPIRISKN